MFKVEVDNYCDDCIHFDPEKIDRIIRDRAGEEAKYCETVIICKNRSLCKKLYKRLKEQNEGSDKQ